MRPALSPSGARQTFLFSSDPLPVTPRQSPDTTSGICQVASANMTQSWVGGVYPIPVCKHIQSLGNLLKELWTHSLSGKPDSLASKQRNRDKSRKENWEEAGAGKMTFGNGSERLAEMSQRRHCT